MAQILDKPKSFIGTIHALRLLAAGMVLLSHLILENLPHRAPVGNLGKIPFFTGVDLFFIVSGFIMYYLTHDKFGRIGYVRTFIKHRFVRVVPLYWICTTLLIFIIVFQSHVVNNKELDLARIAGSYLFLPIPRSDGTFFPIFVLGWTLNFEIFFYTLFAIALGFRKRLGLTIIFSTLSILAIIGLVTRSQIPFVIFYTRPITLEFLYGIVLAHFYLSGVRLPLMVRLGLIVLGFVLLSVAGHLGMKDIYLRFLWGGVPCLLIAAGGVLGTDMPASRGWARLIVEGGGAAYSLYLTHMFAVRAINLVWAHAGLSYGWPFIIAGFVVAMIVAVLTYKLVEAPLLRSMRRLTDKRTTIVPPQVSDAQASTIST